MAFPTSWEPIPAGGTWDPVTNNDPANGDWIELGDIDQTGGGEQIARDDGVKTMMGLVPMAKEYDFDLKTQGCAWADTASPWYLHRINPLPHPKSWLYRCVTADKAGWVPNVANRAVSPAPPSYTALAPSPHLDLTPNGWDGLKAARLPTTNDYEWFKATLRFRTTPYAVMEDSEMFYTVSGTTYRLSEVYRNCEFFSEITPTLDLLLTGNTQFLEWADSAASGPPTAGTPLTAKKPELIQRAALTAVWHAVPWEYIVAPGDYLPKKIMNCIGKTNSTDWYGFPAGTLRFESPRFKKSIQAPVRVVPGNFNATYVFDIILPFSWIDPPAASVLGGTPSGRGWNLSLYSDSGKWYAIRRRSGGGPYLPGVDFNTIFDHVLKP